MRSDRFVFFIRSVRGLLDRCFGRTIRNASGSSRSSSSNSICRLSAFISWSAAFERLIAADLTHPALAAPLAAGIADVAAYLAQDYVGAESLDLAVREHGAAPPADALRVAVQLADALDCAAAVNIVHGALHPRDVLLSTDDARLTGVGVARALEQVGVTAPVRRPYTAPERMAARSGIGAPTCSAWRRCFTNCCGPAACAPSAPMRGPRSHHSRAATRPRCGRVRPCPRRESGRTVRDRASNSLRR